MSNGECKTTSFIARYSIPGGIARVYNCEDGNIRIFVEQGAHGNGIVFLPDPGLCVSLPPVK